MSVSSGGRPVEACEAPSPPGRGLWLFAFAGALILTDAFDATLYALLSDTVRLPGLPLSRAPILVVCAAAGVLLAGNLRGAAERIRDAWLLWPVVGLAFASALWSDQPATTIVWAAALLGTTAFGLALSVRFSAIAQARLTAAVVTTIALGSALVEIVSPIFGWARLSPWTGLYVHKNLLGRVMALGVTAATVELVRERRRVLAPLALLLCGGVLLASESRASFLAAGIAASATMVLLAARSRPRRASAILAASVAAIVLVMVLLLATAPGLRLLRRSETFSDRTLIWEAVVGRVLERPWLGHGYGAFWSGPGGAVAMALVPFPVNQGHDGAVDVAAELGLVGLVLVFAPMMVFVIGAFRHALEPTEPPCLWPATYLVFFIASNVAESSLLRHKLFWALYIAAACHVARRRRRISAPAGSSP